jgi:hypothetical protein
LLRKKIYKKPLVFLHFSPCPFVKFLFLTFAYKATFFLTHFPSCARPLLVLPAMQVTGRGHSGSGLFFCPFIIEHTFPEQVARTTRRHCIARFHVIQIKKDGSSPILPDSTGWCITDANNVSWRLKMATTATRAAQRAAFNAGYRDAINNLPRTPDNPLLTYYYEMGYTEGVPKRLVPTYISTPSGPVCANLTLAHASFLQMSNRHTPGGRR